MHMPIVMSLQAVIDIVGATGVHASVSTLKKIDVMRQGTYARRTLSAEAR